ncbi:aminoglycoside phosphotransferase [Naumannella cuiyingiana]|uniref:Aminoglycoside phosphotransferase n=1 Tax=Naumannella cuiyingiana TaxID=1347891 RepID=A0A7Z0IK99_9ACTN|nr:aminoglycoside phosphotransferase [Naumannella cuiyingiana]
MALVPGLTAGPRDDGADLLTSPRVGELLAVAVEHAGGRLIDWRIDHVDAQPEHSTTATFSTIVDWPDGRRNELLGVSARAGETTDADARAEIFHDGDREVAVWIHPADPDLPGLARLAYPAEMAGVLAPLVGRPIATDEVEVDLLGYRPRRRAVARVRVRGEGTCYVKAVRAKAVAGLRRRHQLLSGVGVPAPELLAITDDHLLLLRELPGRPLATALFDDQPPCTGEDLIGVLDAMPPAIGALGRRPSWVASLDHYVEMVARATPDQEGRLRRLAALIDAGLAGATSDEEPAHGDFHEGQVHVDGGRVVGLLDVDTVGPGRRADDLACLIAHLSTVQRMNAGQAERVGRLLASWVPVFDERVDPVELRLRASAIAISLATGPYRVQEADWYAETVGIIDAAETLAHRAN